jgi:hypothetical protein
MWYFIRFILLWCAMLTVLAHYNVPPIGMWIAYIIYILHGWNEIFDCYRKWLK